MPTQVSRTPTQRSDLISLPTYIQEKCFIF